MGSSLFSEVIKSACFETLQVLDIPNTGDNYIAIDLSESNTDLNDIDLTSSENFSVYINNYLKNYKAQVAYGGYLEIRNIYKRSSHFNENTETERNIHLGLDLWCDAGTKVLAVFAGTVHSFNNNTNYGDYGPTIILKHQIDEDVFYTLYGHLSLESLHDLEVGLTIEQGQRIGSLGTSNVNGDYPPHLHFQVIKDIESFWGDYPGVCSQENLAFYKTNCPDPNILLGLNQ
ncbi:peptidoglycan DD-metalloendopeptidase family protein [Tamlana fucoidanivorans]|uniref:Peptidase M23 n=1 Tax=Allotamlana fucoidanivorans TaxID=2583814 RepID=A0A5C4SQF6_9FLAO|nr:peptidoglycan DD-metalloendopeptidase family protein [Tamlana fucoidanivorans]TNJ45794.1 peptidase M23 [Tamlana fucoidanivorans]